MDIGHWTTDSSSRGVQPMFLGLRGDRGVTPAEPRVELFRLDRER